MDLRRWTPVRALAALGLLFAAPTAQGISLSLLDTNATGIFSTVLGAAEIPAFDPASDRIFVVNGNQARVDILDASATELTNGGGIANIGNIPIAGGSPNSVAVKNGIVAVAIEATNRQAAGRVDFYTTAGAFLNSVTVGALPDMLTFTPDGTKVLVANEGEPNSYNQVSSVDPDGSVSIIDLSGGVGSATVTTAAFTSYNGSESTLRSNGIRIFGPNASASQDLEPEYISVTPDGTTALVSLQEANALATIDIASGTVTSIRSFGLKDHSATGNGLDASDGGGSGGGGAAINIATWPVKGMFQPDSIASFEIGGETYLVTANEGDARDYTGFAEEVRVGAAAYDLDNATFPNEATLKLNANLGRLTVSSATGNTDADAAFEEIHVFGARSFTIWKEDGSIVFDSGDDFEQILSTSFGSPEFNANHDSNSSFDTRSDNKGPEPEGLAIGTVNGRVYAFVGLERVGGVMVYDVTDPANATYVDYVNNRNFAESVTSSPGVSNPLAGDLAPEGLVFVSAADSPTGNALLIVANEVSGTTSVYEIVPEPGTALLLGAGLLGLAAQRRRV